jgi:multiple sugar transport system permease protein
MALSSDNSSPEPVVADVRSRKRRDSRNAGGWFLLSPALTLIAILGIFPLVYMIWMSLHNFDGSNIFGGQFVGLEHFADALGSSDLHNAAIVTVQFLLLTVPIELVLGFAMAQAFYREGPVVGRLQAFLIIPTMVAPVAIGVLWRFMYQSEIGVVNYALTLVGLPAAEWLANPRLALLAVAIVDIWQWTPFMFLILLAGLKGLPMDILEAAKVDGASYLRTVFAVRLPLMRNVVIIATVLRLLDAVRTFDTIFVITRGGPAGATDVYSMATWREAFRFFNLDVASAYSLLFLFVLSVVVPFLLLRLARFEVHEE